MLSGVPQRTVLGPILFIIMMNVIDEGITSTVLSFADDTRIFRGVKNINDCQALHSDLLKIYDWAKKNNMEFNGNKFEVIKFGQNTELKSTSQYNGPNGLPIERSNRIKDLGVIINDNATFDDHIDRVASKCKQLIGFILRTFKSRDKEIMLTLWKTIILPHIDYCSQLWFPYKKCNMHKLEGLQRTFTKHIEPVGVSAQRWLERAPDGSVHKKPR